CPSAPAAYRARPTPAAPGSAPGQAGAGATGRCRRQAGGWWALSVRSRARGTTAPRRGSDAAEHQGAVGAAEAEGVRQRDVDLLLARGVRHVVEVAALGRVVEVDRRRDHAG